MHAMVLLLLVKIGAVRKWFSTVTSQKEVGEKQASDKQKDSTVSYLGWGCDDRLIWAEPLYEEDDSMPQRPTNTYDGPIRSSNHSAWFFFESTSIEESCKIFRRPH